MGFETGKKKEKKENRKGEVRYMSLYLLARRDGQTMRGKLKKREGEEIGRLFVFMCSSIMDG